MTIETKKIVRLDRRTLKTATRELAQRDGHLAEIVVRWGTPPLWSRPTGFSTLVRIILEQQVSLASAAATFKRLRARVNRCTPARILELGEGGLRDLGFTRQKAHYCCQLAHQLQTRRLVLRSLEPLSAGEVRRQLTAVKGIGRWTADIYLLMSLRRPDIWPRGDLALLAAMGHVLKLGQRPDDATASEIAQRWKPWRAVAARLLWHHYLSERRAT